MKQLTFDGVCKQLKKEASFKDLSKNIDVLSSAAIILLGLKSATGDITAFVDILAVKDAFCKTADMIIDKIVGSDINTCEKRMCVVKWAYAMIYYTAFFDVLDKKLPADIRKKLALSYQEKKSIFEEAKNQDKELSRTELEVLFPNVVYDYADIENALKKLYSEMSQGLRNFVQMLSFEEESTERTIAKFNQVVDELPELAIKRFKEQYIYLASRFNEFYVFVQFETEKYRDNKYQDLFKNIIEIMNSQDNKVDVGFARLEGMLLNLPEIYKEERIKEIVNGLIDTYKSGIEKPVIQDDDELQYPSIEEAFIPQSYKVLVYSGNEELGKRKTWADRVEHKDMAKLWGGYFMSPESTDNLLLILGEPGGGKSLLTRILCARMIDKNHVFVRIPLRDVDVDKGIETIVCEQIKKDGDASESIPSFKWFAESFQHNPITIVFDGYDEVLQATGGIYRNLLNKIQDFQDDCALHHRPIRIVITSRETLIDRAEIPKNTMVVNLCEFDEGQVQEWMLLWNQKNSKVFQDYNISEFSLPPSNRSIDELSRQPLLLLMLAIYDANLEEKKNSLSRGAVLNRTKLYNELLQRFIKRELKKGAKGKEVFFNELDTNEQIKEIESQMEKLGVAALGMFNRGKLSLKKGELDNDLNYLQIKMPEYNEGGKKLTNAEILFGSFFFIHDSQSSGEVEDEKEEAFEFLHKTFYEFLLADLLLKYLVAVVNKLNMLRSLDDKSLYVDALKKGDFACKYYTAMIHNCLCTEAETIKMFAEWKMYIIKAYFKGTQDDFDIVMNDLFEYQLQTLCHEVMIPSSWQESSYEGALRKTRLQYCALYIANLLILESITNVNDVYRIKIEQWKYIAQFLKMNLKKGTLLKFISQFSFWGDEDEMSIERKMDYVEAEQKKGIDIQMDVFNFLQDKVTYNIYSLHAMGELSDKQNRRGELIESDIRVDIEMIIGKLQNAIINNMVTDNLIEESIEKVSEIIGKQSISEDLMLNWLILINSCDEIDSGIVLGTNIGFMVERCILLYNGNLTIMLELMKLLKNILVGRFSFDEEVIYQNLKKEILGSPDLVIKFIKLNSSTLYEIDKDKIFSYVLDEFNELCEISPYYAVEFVELFYEKEEIVSCINVLLDNFIDIYQTNLSACVKTIRIALHHGYLDRVKCLLETVDTLPEMSFGTDGLVAVIDLLELSLIVGANLQLEKQLIEYCVDQMRISMWRRENAMYRLLNIIRLTHTEEYAIDMIKELIKHFDVIVYTAPSHIISYLSFFKNDKNVYSRVLNVVLKRFDELVDCSVSSAIEVLGEIKRRNISKQVICLFDYILFKSNEISINQESVCKMLSGLNKQTLKGTKQFLINKLRHIRVVYPLVAQQIEMLYPE